jgi:hypothetical protein
VPPRLLVEAAYELAESTGDEADGGLSQYRETLGRSVASLPVTPLTAAMVAVLDELTCSLTGWPHGAWHGDWTPWNMGVLGGRLCVWDWERFAAPVPLGMDLLHHHFQTDVMLHARPPRTAALDLVDWSPPSPDGRSTANAAQQRALATLYLLGLGTRYLADDQAATGNRLGAVATWLEPVLATSASRRGATELPKERA